MVCAFCGSKTEVTNSRLQKRSNQIWRRRRCQDCLRVFTTHEATDLGAIFLVSKAGKTEPFLADKLYTEILLALQDRKDCYKDAREATFTVIKNTLKNAPDATIPAQSISQEAAKVLKRLDKRAWLRFVAEHPSIAIGRAT